MSNNRLRLTPVIRQQFTFTANDRTLNEIIAKISNRGVSFTAFTITKLHEINLVRIVVGPPRSNDPASNRVVREVLDSLGVKYKEEQVIQLLGLETGAQGVLTRIYSSLFREVKVRAIYQGEENAIILNVSNIKKALRLLAEEGIIRY
ncbi:hypothetical protein [Mesobacillus jeotgali]|uniref:hypothetical protein n=1 Tax=Mesobacillus jeotgali TaxID=129985 RepID=UPI0009A84CA8|nr:hypothetical protein [Mesobacillus jeotgali]